MRSGASLHGIWMGALLVSCPVAVAVLYLITGKIPVPECVGGGLRSPEELAAEIDKMVREQEEAH